MNKLNFRFNRASGATIVEFSLIFLLFMSIVFAIFYLGFHSITKSLVDAGIGKALDMAAIHPGFNEDPPTGCAGKNLRECCALSANSSKLWCQTLEEVEQEALKIPQSSLLRDTPGSFAYILSDPEPVDVTLPLPKGNESLNIAYKETPIEIKLTYNVLNILGSYDTITRTGYIFRESPTSAAYNVTTDCHGNPEHSPLYNKQPCVCDSADGFASAIQDGAASCMKCSAISSYSIHSSPTSQQIISNLTGQSINTHGANTYNLGNVTSSLCLCPTHDYCAHLYGAGSYMGGQHRESGGQSCECLCLTSFGTTASASAFNTNCQCSDTVPASAPTQAGFNDHGGTKPAVTFNPNREVLRFLNAYTVCACKLSPESKAIYSSDTINKQMCEDWLGFGWDVGYGYCGCRCRLFCGQGSPNYTTCSCNCNANASPNAQGTCACDSSLCQPGFKSVKVGPTCQCQRDCLAHPCSYPSGNDCLCATGGTYPNCNDCGGGGE